MKSSWVTGAVQIWSEIVVELWQFLSSVKIQLVGANEKKKKLYIYSVQTPPPPFLQGGELSFQLNFQKGGGAWQGKGLKISTFRGGLLGKRGVTFFRGCDFHIKNKVKSEIVNDKKSLQSKIFFSAITKNSNYEILPKNLVTFKR